MQVLRSIFISKELFSLYFATFVMRAAAFLCIAVLGSKKFLDTDAFILAVIVAMYPASELLTVMFFGVLVDVKGRKPILVFAHGLTALAAFLFIITNHLLWLGMTTAIFGVGAAAKVTSTLTLVADYSTITDRAKNMGLFDIVTLGGLASGYILGVVLLNFYEFDPIYCFLIATLVVLISVVIVQLFVKETKKVDYGGEGKEKPKYTDMFQTVLKDKRIKKLLPVYIPVICIYGLVITFTERIIEEGDSVTSGAAIKVLGVVGIALISSLLIMGKASDITGKRKPFIIVGLFCFGALAILLVHYRENIGDLWSIWPVVFLIGFGAGAFPPAILAYLADITEHQTRGTSFGIYSLILGTGLIIGPLSGGIALDTYGMKGFMVLIGILVTFAALAATRLPETRFLEEEKLLDHAIKSP